MAQRIQITLVCSVCESRNYRTTRKPEQKGRLSIKKHCPKCNKHTEHRETK